MPNLLSNIRRAFRSQTRLHSISRGLSRLADSNALIAKGLAIVIEQEYGIDISAPQTAIDKRDPLTVSYVDDRQQALREEQEKLEQSFGVGTGAETGARAGDRGGDRDEFERMLDEIG